MSRVLAMAASIAFFANSDCLAMISWALPPGLYSFTISVTSFTASSKRARCFWAISDAPLAIACHDLVMASRFFWWCSMILATSTCGSLSCSPRFLNMSVKFCGVWAMRTSLGLKAELQPLLQRVQGQTGEAADHRTIEADIL